MRQSDLLAGFVQDALAAGHSRAEIEAQLKDAGWSQREIAAATSAWAISDFAPPVPRPRPHFSAAEVFFYGLTFGALAFSAGYLVSLAFGVIDIWLPEIGDEYANDDYARRDIRWAISSLAVSMPVLVYLEYRTRRRDARDAAHRRSTVRNSLAYLVLFCSAFAILADIAGIIYAFLSGDVTSRLLAKSAVIALVAGSIFLYFIQDTRERTRAD